MLKAPKIIEFVKKHGVIVNSSEPTSGEEVWFKNGKNLFDGNTIFKAWIDTTTQKIISAADEYYSCYVKIMSNTTYTISKNAGHSFRIATTTEIPNNGVSYNNTLANHSGTSITITTGQNDKYICIFFYATGNGDTGGYQNMANSIQVEQGSTATSFEPHIEKEIYCKNTNGVYEKFYSEKEVPKIKTTTISATTGTELHHGWYFVDINVSNYRITKKNLVNISASVSGNGLFMYQWIDDAMLRARSNLSAREITMYISYLE